MCEQSGDICHSWDVQLAKVDPKYLYSFYTQTNFVIRRGCTFKTGQAANNKTKYMMNPHIYLVLYVDCTFSFLLD